VRHSGRVRTPLIDNPRSPRVRAVAKLSKRDARTETGLFLLEGPQAVAEALAFRPELVLELFVTPTALERHPGLAGAAAEAELEAEFVTEAVLDAMADTVTPQGVVAVCRQFPTSVKDIFAEGDDGGPKLIAILEEVRDPGNAGTIIRAADAAGADAVVMTGRSVLASVVARCAEAGIQVIAADVKGDDLLEARRDGVLAAPTAWLFGNEARGLTDDDLAKADRAVVVPIYGHAESMNHATAASVCLYESAFAQRS
jgi:TrmH family RNA methyltransferase